MAAKMEWYEGELFPRMDFIVTNSNLAAKKLDKAFNGRGTVKNQFKKGKIAMQC